MILSMTAPVQALQHVTSSTCRCTFQHCAEPLNFSLLLVSHADQV